YTRRLRTPQRPPPFPYTTLFRSVPPALQLRDSNRPRLHNFISLLVVKRNSPPSGLIKAIDGIGKMPKKGIAPEFAISNYVKAQRSEEHTSELQSRGHLVCRLLLE